MKRIFGVIAGVLFACLLAFGASAVTMYSSDGRTIEVEWYDIETYEAVWWRKEIKVYKPDGTSMAINPFEVDKYEAEGWCRELKYYRSSIGAGDAFNNRGSIYDNSPEHTYYASPYGDHYSKDPTYYTYFKGVLTYYNNYNNYCEYKNSSPFNYYYPSSKAVYTMYAPDGRILFVKPSEVQAYRDAGWYEGIILFKKLVDYDEDRYPQTVEYNVTKTISPFSTEEQLKMNREAGWSEGVKMYSPNGGTQIFPSYQADLYRRNGWYYGYTMYNSNGEVKTVPGYDYDNYYNNGWRVSVTMYSIDETMTNVTEIEINPYLRDEYLAVGYLDFSPLKMYSMDGREIYVAQNRVTDFQSVGWYLDKADVTVTMYADERTLEVFKGQIADYQAVGWSLEPVRIMYAEDGRTIYVPESQIEAFEAVGWYTSKYDVMITVYAADGRTMKIFRGQTEAYKAVGWYPAITIYTIKYNTSFGGNYMATKEINPFEFESYSKENWFTEPVVKLYSLYGDSVIAPKSQIEQYRAVGWYNYDEVYTKVYKADDYKIVLKSETWKYTSQGYAAGEPPFGVWHGNWIYAWVHSKQRYGRVENMFDVVNYSEGKILTKIEFTMKYYDGQGKAVKDVAGKSSYNITKYVSVNPSVIISNTTTSKKSGASETNIEATYSLPANMNNYLHRIDFTNFKAYFNDGTTATVPGTVTAYTRHKY